MYKPCYKTCKSCIKEGNEIFHNCVECNYNFGDYMQVSNYFNCFNLSLQTYTTDMISNTEYFSENLNFTEEYEYKNINIIEYKNNDISNKSNSILENILKNKNITSVLLGKDIESKFNDILVTLSTIKNQKSNINKNKTSIDLGECIKILKLNYNISDNESLFILMFEKKEERMKIPKIEYEIYHQLNLNKLKILNLSLCKDTKVDILIPVNIDDDIEKYNLSSKYYNDICSRASSEFETDISLADRREIFIKNNLTLCEENCELTEYNYEFKKAKCTCQMKINKPLIEEDIKFDKKKFFKRFSDINQIANFKCMKCYKNIINKKYIKKNYGFFILMSILTIYFVDLILFYLKYNSYLNKTIYKLENIKKNQIKKNELKNEKNKNIEQTSNNGDLFKKEIGKNNPGNILILSNDKNNERKNKSERDNLQSAHLISKKLVKKIKIRIKKIKKRIKFSDKELNSLDYEKALIHDKRTFCQYYLSLLKANHLLIFSFYNNNDYNSQIVKFFLFFFFFSSHFTINTLFFNDDTIHQIYKDEGSFNFIYQIPQIIYSSIISTVLDIIIKYLALTENEILNIKQIEIVSNLTLEVNRIKRFIKIKFILFYSITFLFLLFFWYYISSFCGVYVNTQIH